jgi:hypothetical protein
MRKVIVLLALGLLAASSASAASFWTESFSYANGGLVAVAGGAWATHSGTGTDIQVLNGEAVITQTNAPDDNRTFPAATATAKTYACFKMKISGTQTTAGTYFIHFKDTGTMNFAARLVAYLNDATTYKLGIGATSATVTQWPSVLTKDTYYNVTMMYDAAAGSAKLWVDAAVETDPSVTATGGSTGFLLSALALRQASGYGIATVDDITVGDTFCPEPVVPTSSESWSSVKSQYR